MKAVLFLPHHFRKPEDMGGLRSWHLVNALKMHRPVVVIVPGVDTLTGQRVDYLSRHAMWALDPDSDSNVTIYRVNSLANDRSVKLKRALYYISFSVMQALRAISIRHVGAVVTTSMPVTSMTLGFLIAKMRRIPFIIDVRDLPTDLAVEIGYLRDGFFSRFVRRIERFLFKRADLVVAVSHGMAQLLVAKGVSHERLAVIPIGYDALPMEGIAPVTIDFPIENKTLVLYAGTMGHVIDIDTLLDAAELSKPNEDIVYLLVGDGQRFEEYRTRAAEEGLNCHFTGRLQKHRVAAICAVADVCVYPLIEGKVISTLLGNKIFDYMGAAKPTIFLGPAGDIEQLIESADAGICLPPRDAAGLVAAIRQLMDDPAERQRLGANARAYVEKHLIARQLNQQFAAAIESTIHGEARS